MVVTAVKCNRSEYNPTTVFLVVVLHLLSTVLNVLSDVDQAKMVGFFVARILFDAKLVVERSVYSVVVGVCSGSYTSKLVLIVSGSFDKSTILLISFFLFSFFFDVIVSFFLRVIFKILVFLVVFDGVVFFPSLVPVSLSFFFLEFLDLLFAFLSSFS